MKHPRVGMEIEANKSCLISTPRIVKRTNKVNMRPRDGAESMELIYQWCVISSKLLDPHELLCFIGVHLVPYRPSAYSHGPHRETRMNMLWRRST
ncbi:hypothetical protein CY34DRAFT_491577 [Suillus luteus UH-Slu-Lm8-n1]|uniref:Uncharacterized protein n=1 Tax=Suillus luteus UH-Slu-Lm8-n1 TaxID=930992 RepID=A0A0C9ZHB9_9AGAM|nr:hypothetical protein CY34DRAFT_491577 [Suillus luteus UH-Slu-Lm8-n1]